MKRTTIPLTIFCIAYSVLVLAAAIHTDSDIEYCDTLSASDFELYCGID